MIYNFFPKFHVRHEGVSFHGPRKSDEEADTKAYLIKKLSTFYDIPNEKLTIPPANT